MPTRRRSVADRVATRPALPRISHFLVDEIQTFLTTRWWTKRPPDVSARTLALVVELWRHSMPFPERQHAADELNCTRWGIDAAITLALGRELISIHVETPWREDRGAIGVFRMKYYIPCQELVDLAARIPAVNHAA